MSFEETLICDGCSCVVSGGPRGQTVPEVLARGGAAFRPGGRLPGMFTRCTAEKAAATSTRHLCPRCVDRKEFFDGVPVPQDGEQ